MNWKDLRRFPSAALVLFLGVASISAPAGAAVGEWVAGSQSRMRLAAYADAASGRLDAAIEIELDGGWKTYWRFPGDAGFAPIADFSGSVNLKPPELFFPVPTRMDDGFSVSNIYFDRVVILATGALVDPARPARLDLKLDIGVCQEVCIPEHLEAVLDVAPGEDAAASAIVAEARRFLPSPPEPGVFDVEDVRRAGGADKRPVFEIVTRVPDPDATKVFVEGPADWYPDTPTLVSASGPAAVYRVAFDRLTAKSPIAGASLRVTVVSGGRAIEKSISLD